MAGSGDAVYGYRQPIPVEGETDEGDPIVARLSGGQRWSAIWQRMPCRCDGPWTDSICQACGGSLWECCGKADSQPHRVGCHTQGDVVVLSDWLAELDWPARWAPPPAIEEAAHA